MYEHCIVHVCKRVKTILWIAVMKRKIRNWHPKGFALRRRLRSDSRSLPSRSMQSQRRTIQLTERLINSMNNLNGHVSFWRRPSQLRLCNPRWPLCRCPPRRTRWCCHTCSWWTQWCFYQVRIVPSQSHCNWIQRSCHFHLPKTCPIAIVMGVIFKVKKK